jgi:hypothetical protein
LWKTFPKAVQPSSVSSLPQWSQLFDDLLTVLTALFPILARTSGSERFTEPPSPGKLLFGVAGDLRVIFGDIFRVDIFLAGEALGDTEVLGESTVRGEGALDGVLVGVLGDGLLLGELVLATVSRLVGLLRPGEAVWFFTALLPGDFERVLGELGTDRAGRGETGRENGVLGEPRGEPRGDPGIDRLFLFGRHRPPQQSSSSSRSSLLCFTPSGCNLLILAEISPKSFSPLKLLLILGEFILTDPIIGLFGAEFVLDILSLELQK